MPTILSPSGIEKPDGPEQHSRAMLNRNYDRTNDIEIARLANTGIPFGHAGRTGGFQTIGGVDVGVVLTAAQETRGGMTFETASGGRFVIPKTGLYEVRTRIYATAGSGYSYDGAAYKNSAVIPGSQISSYKATSSDTKEFTLCTIPLAVNDKIGLGMTSTQQTWGTDGYNGAWLEVKWVGE